MINSRNYPVLVNNILLFSDLSRVLLALQKVDISVIILKGAALAVTLYPNLSERPMGDIDLLVKADQLATALAVMEELGYIYQPDNEGRLNPFNTIFTGEMKFVREQYSIIDLHWEIIPLEWLRRLFSWDVNVIWRDAQAVEIDGAHAFQLSPQDMLLHLCVHLIIHNFAHPVGFQDIVRLVNHYRPFPWNSFLKRVKQSKTTIACYFVLETASNCLDASVPQYVLESLTPSKFRMWFVKLIANPKFGLLGEISPSHARSYLLHIAVADRIGDALRVIFWLMFPGRSWLVQRYDLHGHFIPWLAVFWQPWYVVWQGINGLIESIKSNHR